MPRTFSSLAIAGRDVAPPARTSAMISAYSQARSSALRHVGRRELRPTLLQRSEEGDVTRESVELRNHKPGARNLRSFEGGSELRSVVSLAALHFGELSDNFPAALLAETYDGVALGL